METNVEQGYRRRTGEGGLRTSEPSLQGNGDLEDKRPPRWDWRRESLSVLGAAAVIGGLAYLPHGEGAVGGQTVLGKSLPLWTLFPFPALLLCIALLPLTV